MAIICDLDGTLADCSHRLHHLNNGGKPDWPAFFAAMKDDTPLWPIIDLVRTMDQIGHSILICSGRPEQYRAVTEAWLQDHGVPYATLHMRPDGDHRPDHIVKSAMLDAILADDHGVDLVIDDRPSVVRMWRARGLTCLQAADWSERPRGAPGLLTLMVGPSGAGKTAFLHSPQAEAMSILPWHVLSSDQVRADLCGDFRCQDRNDDVFAAVHAIARERLRHGLPVVIDATNITRKARLACVDCAPDGGRVRYIVIDRPLEAKYAYAGWRASITGADGKPFDLIGKHHHTFQSQLPDILAGDNLPNVSVIDLR